jgi:hypothetical protein
MMTLTKMTSACVALAVAASTQDADGLKLQMFLFAWKRNKAVPGFQEQQKKQK